MTARRPLGRRDFLKLSAGAGLWLAVSEPGRVIAADPSQPPDGFAPSAWLHVGPDGVVTVHLGKSEMGQGTFTGMAVLIAEELEADWKKVRVLSADADPRFGNMVTGGSRSVRGNFIPLRKVGAAAREVLVAAGAKRLGVKPAACRAEEGAVVHGASGRRLEYGALVADAAKLPVPGNPRLKDPRSFRLIGKRVPRLDTPPKVAGRAVFGLDVRVPGMRYAAVARPPTLGGKVKGFDAAAAGRVPGVIKVVEVPSGVAVIADSSWSAFRGRDALAATFAPGPDGALDTAGLSRRLAEAPVASEPMRSVGDVERALAGAARRLEAAYTLPLLAHATMEPMNCVASVGSGKVELWAPTQAPTWARSEVARALGVSESAVTVHVTFLGGGFGRRAMPDFAVEAAEVSRAAGVPVQVVWTRTDDLRHDFYRPPGRNELRAGLDAKGRLVAWHHRVRTPSISRQLGHTAAGAAAPDVGEGAQDVPYTIPAIRVDQAAPEPGVPIGWWRSVYSSQNAFAEEVFMDELARAAGKDPLAFRLAHLPRTSRLRGVLQLAAEKAGWGGSVPKGRGLGIACHASFGSYVAHVAEVSVRNGRIAVHRVVTAVDCGTALNPDSVEHQAEGSVVYGLSAALRGEITLKDGAVVQANFDDYEPLRMSEVPKVEVHLVPSQEEPGGMGEPALPPIAPAVANAVFAATGERLRSLPLRPAGRR
jgi:isoquinoline 1-oxidoreductase beta subunit